MATRAEILKRRKESTEAGKRMSAGKSTSHAEFFRRRKRAAIDAYTTSKYKKAPVKPLTPQQIRSQEAAARRKGWMPAGLRKLYEALGGK